MWDFVHLGSVCRAFLGVVEGSYTRVIEVRNPGKNKVSYLPYIASVYRLSSLLAVAPGFPSLADAYMHREGFFWVFFRRRKREFWAKFDAKSTNKTNGNDS